MKFLINLIPFRKLRRRLRFERAYHQPKKTYSQVGEDVILSHFFAGRHKGFYVDVGAHHPWRYSNTALLYKKGWRGINIDPLPRTKAIFDRERPGDINLELGIAQVAGELTYHMFSEPALNSFDQKLSESRERDGGSQVIARKTILCRPLRDVLVDQVPEGQRIDLLSVDVEGLDLVVLESNDWTKYRPHIVVVEALDAKSIKEALDSKIVRFLSSEGYVMVAAAGPSLFMRDARDS